MAETLKTHEAERVWMVLEELNVMFAERPASIKGDFRRGEHVKALLLPSIPEDRVGVDVVFMADPLELLSRTLEGQRVILQEAMDESGGEEQERPVHEQTLNIRGQATFQLDYIPEKVTFRFPREEEKPEI